ncbi:hypothetical protein WJ969_17770 [Achromobacter xylosoxidans]
MPYPGVALVRGNHQFPDAGQRWRLHRRVMAGPRERRRQHALAGDAARDPPVHQQPYGFLAHMHHAEAQAMAAGVLRMFSQRLARGRRAAAASAASSKGAGWRAS